MFDADDDWGVDADDWGDGEPAAMATTTKTNNGSLATTDWCAEANDWGDEDQTEEDFETKDIKEDGNKITSTKCSYADVVNKSTESETEVTNDKTNTEENETLDKLKVMMIDDEIESDSSSSGVAAVDHCMAEDLPVNPESDIMSILRTDETQNQTDKPVSESSVSFESFFVSVTEDFSDVDKSSLKHERQLLAEYSKREGVKLENLMDTYEG